jgi:phospholipase/lecithinase/hemolysin
MKLARALVLAALAFVVPVGAATTPTFLAFHTFGDSLADNGNVAIATSAVGIVPAIPPSTSPNRTYFNGRFSNGPVAFEYLWTLVRDQKVASQSLRPVLSLRHGDRPASVNFGFGGSGTGFIGQTPDGFPVLGLQGQVALYGVLSDRLPHRKALYAIFSGANDYLGPQPLSYSVVVANIARAVRQLYVVGARDILVLNLPDLGQIPLVAGQPALSAALTAVSMAHNAALALAVDQLNASLRGADVKLIDVNAVVEEAAQAGINTTVPALDTFGLTPLPGGTPVSFCLIVNPALCPDVPTFDVGLQYLFWDAQHPTTAVHELLAQYIYGELAN